jgi:methyl-accepting chemotaxis protein
MTTGVLKVNIGDSTANLEKLSQAMEEDFLALGEQLYRFRERSQAISQKATEVGTQITGSDLGYVMESLGNFQEKITKTEEGSIRGLKALQEILDRFREVASPLRSMDKIIRFLDIICVIMKIENARLNELQTGFGTTAQSLKDLGQTIRTKAEELDTNTTAIAMTVRQSLQTIQENERYKNSQAQLILSRILDSLAPLKIKRTASAGMLHNLATRYQTISRSIGEVVSSLQFHDITRQRIEHSTTALKEIEPVFANPDQKIPDLEAEKAIAVSHIQLIQLNHAKEDLSRAVGTVKEGLHALAREVAEISQEARDLIGHVGQSGTSFFNQVEDNLTSLKAASKNYLSINKEIAASMASVKDFGEEISVFANDIKNIGTGIRIVAINASVNASRIGSKGSSFGVLAQNTQDLASETASQIEQVSSALKSIVSLAQELAVINHDAKSNVSEKAQGLENELETIDSLLRSTDIYAEDNLATIGNQSGTFKNDISAAISSLRSPEAFLNAISDTCRLLDAFLRSAQKRFPEAYASASKLKLNDLTDRYTMEREREIHRSVLAPRALASSKNTSPRTGHGQGVAIDLKSSPSSSIGDNVTLF